MEIQKKSRNVVVVSMDDIQSGWEKWFFLSSDRHHDSQYCDRTLTKIHLEAVVERDAHILDFGDFFDAMQGKYDPRKEYRDIRTEYMLEMISKEKGYFDVIVDDASDFYKRYARRFLVITRGNHETSVYKHNSIDLTGRLVEKLNKKGKAKIITGGYGGWVRFIFRSNGNRSESYNLKYFHGKGGSAPVTKGVIQANRQAVDFPNADIVVNGHIHESWLLALKREYLSDKAVVKQGYQYHIRTAGYHNGYDDGYGGFSVEKGSPKPLGGVWMRFFFRNTKIHVEFTQALG